MLPEIHFLGLAAPTYVFVLSLVYCLCIFYFLKRIKNFGLKPTVAIDLMFVVMIASFVGARLFYVFYQDFDFYRQDPLQILLFWRGGFVFYGGLLCGLFFGYLFLRFKNQNLVVWANAATPVLALGYGLGRFACFLNGCCYGDFCYLPWAVRFPHLVEARHPTQLYALIYEISLWFVLVLNEKKLRKKSTSVSILFFTWIFFHGLGRIIMEIFRADDRGQLLFGVSVAIIISLILMIWASCVLLRPAFQRFSKKH